MGMSTFVIGFVPPDDRWRKMKAIYDACIEAEVDIPKEVEEFFGGGEPDPAGMEQSLSKLLREWSNDGGAGYELDVADIPKNVKTIRFYNSW